MYYLSDAKVVINLERSQRIWKLFSTMRQLVCLSCATTTSTRFSSHLFVGRLLFSRPGWLIHRFASARRELTKSRVTPWNVTSVTKSCSIATNVITIEVVSSGSGLSFSPQHAEAAVGATIRFRSENLTSPLAETISWHPCSDRGQVERRVLQHAPRDSNTVEATITTYGTHYFFRANSSHGKTCPDDNIVTVKPLQVAGSHRTLPIGTASATGTGCIHAASTGSGVASGTRSWPLSTSTVATSTVATSTVATVGSEATSSDQSSPSTQASATAPQNCHALLAKVLWILSLSALFHLP